MIRQMLRPDSRSLVCCHVIFSQSVQILKLSPIPDIFIVFHAAAALIIRRPERSLLHQAQEGIHHVRRQLRTGNFFLTHTFLLFYQNRVR